MTREEKNKIIESLVEKINNYPHFYLTDASGLNAELTYELRKRAYNNNIKVVVVKNTLFLKALEKSEKKEIAENIKPLLKLPTAVMFTEVGNAPAKLIKKFRKDKGQEKPLLKGAYVEESVYVGEESLEALAAIKSKEELIGDLILLLQSPMQKVLSQLNSGKHILAGIAKALSEREG